MLRRRRRDTHNLMVKVLELLLKEVVLSAAPLAAVAVIALVLALLDLLEPIL